ncbi:prion-inhibition and propagation-domain-containing protein [Microdochium trichocladiopsis]|uniref:Prion-inhibition and propagation-domain-containing protein n=1 Tax=Microdochium trichocladiopsis TaxID=1682393 RepID=A0A9P9BKP8_9PEZI|nr:prion-inhibition and propagation-domain-containing protein [Microdochium trichocladiopsis]KAH7021431.1 prion-inhibition and propagation-domain-containing protein [Microdochium trichocladiopsis]
MSGGLLEIPAFVIGVAGLFTSCVDAFGYFKLYQNATRDIEIILVKLDIEKARLIIWGENVGMLSADRRSPQLLDERMANLVKRVLEQIHELLTDSDKLTTTYGLRIPGSSFSRAVDYLSAKSQLIYKASSDRFWVRNASRLAGFTRGSRAARTKWAIHEREKFQELVNNLGHFIDRLIELIHVSREILDRVVVEDIESIIDISCLTIVEDATESYPVYLEAARSAKALTEAGTLDRRTLEEHIRDRSDIEPAQSGPTEGSEGSESELEFCSRYIVLTSPCRTRTTDEPCDVRFLGYQVTMGLSGQNYRPKWDVSSHTRVSRNTIWSIVERSINVSAVIKEKVEYGVLGSLLKLGTSDSDSEATPEQLAFIKAGLPLLNLYIYCSPCVCLIHTAITVCKELESPYVTVQLRPDSRLASSCCSTVGRSLGMRDIGEWIRTNEATATNGSTPNALAKFRPSVYRQVYRAGAGGYGLPHCDSRTTISRVKETSKLVPGRFGR